MGKGMLVDTTKCIGCRACQVACKQWNQLPTEETVFSGSYENPPATSARTWTRVVFREHQDREGVKWYFAKQGCMHCNDAACMIVCPAGAIFRTDTGAVVVDHQKCIGCNYCASVCPFHTMSFDRRTNLAPKCTFCHDRELHGRIPACAQACPTGALVYGPKTSIVRLAYNRVDELRAAGVTRARTYGLDELGGTGMFYVLADEPARYGLPEDPQVPLSARFWGALFTPLRVLVVLAVALGLWTNRAEVKKMQLGKENGSDEGEK